MLSDLNALLYIDVVNKPLFLFEKCPHFGLRIKNSKLQLLFNLSSENAFAQYELLHVGI